VRTPGARAVGQKAHAPRTGKRPMKFTSRPSTTLAWKSRSKCSASSRLCSAVRGADDALSLAHNSQAKLRIQQEYKQKEKDADTQRRIQRAIVSGEVRIRKMQARDELVQKVKKTAVAKLGSKATADANAYAELLKKLIIQGLIKLNEPRVEVQCREADLPLVRKVLEPAAREYEKLILGACNESVKVEVVIADGKPLPPATAPEGNPTCAGGVKVSAKYGRIVLDNTLDARLDIAFEELMCVVFFVVRVRGRVRGRAFF